MENAPAKGETPKKSFFLPCSQQRLFGLVEDWNEAVFGEKAVRKTSLTRAECPFLAKPFPMIAAHVLIWLGHRVLRREIMAGVRSTASLNAARRRHVPAVIGIVRRMNTVLVVS